MCLIVWWNFFIAWKDSRICPLLRSLSKTVDTIEQQLKTKSLLFYCHANRNDNLDFNFYNLWKNNIEQKSTKKYFVDQACLLSRSYNNYSFISISTGLLYCNSASLKCQILSDLTVGFGRIFIARSECVSVSSSRIRFQTVPIELQSIPYQIRLSDLITWVFKIYLVLLNKISFLLLMFVLHNEEFH